MSFTEGHALCCDCDECLCRGGGSKTASLPRVEPTPSDRVPAWRLRGPNAEAARAKDAERCRAYRAKRRKELAEFRQWRAAQRRAS